MEFEIVVAPRARDDLIEISDYNALDSPENARRWIAQLEQVMASLSTMPTRVGIRDDLRNGYRVLPVQSYLIFFRITGREVQIARVIHSARDIAKAFGDPNL